MNDLVIQLLRELDFYLDEYTFHQIYGEDSSFEDFKKQMLIEGIIDVKEINNIQKNNDEKQIIISEDFKKLIKEPEKEKKLSAIKRYRIMRKMWLSLKKFEKEYGEFSFSSPTLTLTQQYEELVNYYRNIIRNVRSKKND